MLEGRGLTKQFGGLVALRDLDLEVHDSEILGVIGPNGAGKSTLLNVISGAYPEPPALSPSPAPTSPRYRRTSAPAWVSPGSSSPLLCS